MVTWYCWRCKVEHSSLLPATAMYCARGHAMKKQEPDEAKPEPQPPPHERRSLMQLHLFDNKPVLSFQASIAGVVDVQDGEADDLTMHAPVVIVLTGVIDTVNHKTLKSGDLVRVAAVKVLDAHVAQGDMRTELLEVFNLEGGGLFAYTPPRTDADAVTGEIADASEYVVPIPTPASTPPPATAPAISTAVHHDPALASFLAEANR